MPQKNCKCKCINKSLLIKLLEVQGKLNKAHDDLSSVGVEFELLGNLELLHIVLDETGLPEDTTINDVGCPPDSDSFCRDDFVDDFFSGGNTNKENCKKYLDGILQYVKNKKIKNAH